MNVRKRIVAGLSAACLAGALALTAAPAQAVQDPDLRICNSINSVSVIKVWRYGSGATLGFIGPYGACTTFTGQTTLRVDVDTDNPSFTDADSYYIGQEGEGYGPCHDGENSASDPPNIGPNQYVKYNTNAGSC